MCQYYYYYYHYYYYHYYYYLLLLLLLVVVVKIRVEFGKRRLFIGRDRFHIHVIHVSVIHGCGHRNCYHLEKL